MHGDAQVACKPVAGTTGDDAQCGGCFDDGACHLVHRAISADGHYGVETHVDGFASQDRSMSGIFCFSDGEFIVCRVESVGNHGLDIFLIPRSRDGVDDKQDFLFGTHGLQQGIFRVFIRRSLPLYCGKVRRNSPIAFSVSLLAGTKGSLSPPWMRPCKVKRDLMPAGLPSTVMSG